MKAPFGSRWLAPLGAVASLAIAPRAVAQEAAAAAVAGVAAEPPARFELFARGAFVSPPVRGGVTPFGLGGGAGVGVALGPIYLAGSVLGFAGGSDDTGASEHAFVFGGEVGYELRPAPRFTLRPFFGVGGASVTHAIPNASTTSTTVTPTVRGALAQAPDVITQATSSSGGGGGGGGSSSSTDTVVTTYFLEPGVAAIYAAPSGVYAGVRASVLYFPHVSYDASTSASWLPYGLALQVGQRF